MKWHSPTERTQLFLVSPIIVPVVAIAAIIFSPFIPVVWARRCWMRRQARKGWHAWFAWRPVKLGQYRDGRWVWGEAIERKVREYRRSYEYRLPGELAS